MTAPRLFSRIMGLALFTSILFPALGCSEALPKTISGRLPPEVIQSIVRSKFGRFRACYENGLRRNPTLFGIISVRFVIDRDGSVSRANDLGSSMPDMKAVQCVLWAFNNLSFPAPDNGIVTVVYPIMFSPYGADNKKDCIREKLQKDNVTTRFRTCPPRAIVVSDIPAENVNDAFANKRLRVFERQQRWPKAVRGQLTLAGRPAWRAARAYPRGGWETMVITTNGPTRALIISCVDQLTIGESEWCATAVLEAFREATSSNEETPQLLTAPDDLLRPIPENLLTPKGSAEH